MSRFLLYSLWRKCAQTIRWMDDDVTNEQTSLDVESEERGRSRI